MSEKPICSEKEFFIFTVGLMFGAAAGFLKGWALLAVLVWIILGLIRALSILTFDYEIVRKKVKR